MKKTIICVLLALSMIACTGSSKFKVEGQLGSASGKTVYLEHMGLMGLSVVDSLVLDADGTFAFKVSSPEFPDLYRLRVGNQYVVLAVDSIETITIKGEVASLSTVASIEGSGHSVEIATLRQSLRTASREEHKIYTEQMILNSLKADPRSMAAYYALFQAWADAPVFDWNNPADLRFFKAVATSFNVWMPDYCRTKAMYTQVLDVINSQRKALNDETMRQVIAASENTFLDIALPDVNGDTCRLGDLRGRLVVLDFSGAQMERSNAYVLSLREVYNTYQAKGMTIYSVSLDKSKLIWEDWARELPWTTVWAGEDVSCIYRYNVQALPTMFLLDRQGYVVGRYSEFSTLKRDIQKYL